jgi:hypothetical protein
MIRVSLFIPTFVFDLISESAINSMFAVLFVGKTSDNAP